ncbi:MAG: redox-regulated ATPase YchF [Deltaproteobacteria bacterium]|nr:redox-regulated ATPase YchF [Deltaproteobacteria bacterium]
MSLQIGIVGLPNVGKSTLFNALLKKQQAESANYPFCTIEPNTGTVAVPDPRLEKLAQMEGSAKLIPAAIEFVDIAGLVRGASRGEGLGNQFLSHIRETDAILHLLRHFEDENIIRAEGSGSHPKEDREIIEMELILADLESVEKRIDKQKSGLKSGNKEAQAAVALLEKIKEALQAGRLANTVKLEGDEEEPFRAMQLLTSKPVMYGVNLSEEEVAGADLDKIKGEIGLKPTDVLVPFCARVEAELIDFDGAERQEMLEAMGLKEPSINTLIRNAYTLLGLITYFTVGPKEARAWPIPVGCSAPRAAGEIHTDFEKGFIRAEVTAFKDFVELGGQKGAKEAGRLKVCGKDYIMQDGDICNFLFHV